MKTDKIKALQKAKENAISKNGECISNEYITSHSRMEWKCNNSKHSTWLATYSSVVNAGGWCPKCRFDNLKEMFKNNNGLENAKEHAISKGGQCLSKEYINSKTKMEWKCHNSEHRSWFIPYTNVINSGSWCPQCSKENYNNSKTRLSNNLTKAKEHAISKKGQCLTVERINGKEKLEWKCANKTHKAWFAVYTSIVNNNSWCPDCALDYNKQEFKVQQILNYLFKTNFEKTRDLKWNLNPKTNFILELDGYSKDLNIAFEFQGRHHFEDNIFKGTKLSDVQYRDNIKKENCIKNKVQLIIINELRNKKNCLNFFNKILEGIRNTNLKIPQYDYNEIEKLYKLLPKNKKLS